MRLFTGIEPAAAVIEKLAPLLREAHGVPAANLHITLKFIGSWPEERLDEMKTAIDKVPLPAPFPIRIAGLTMLAKALCAEVEAGSGLAALAENLDADLEPLGIARETRRFTPHLTLARSKHENIGTLRHMIGKMGNIDFGTFEASEFHLYLSRPGATGSVYTKLATWQFTPGSDR